MNWPIKLALLISTCLFFEGKSPSGASDWPQFLGPDRNGVSSEKDLIKSWPKDGPKILWEREVGVGYSGPAVSEETLILFHRLDDKEVVQALDSETAKTRWSFSYDTNYQDDLGKGDGPRSTPLLSNGFGYTLRPEVLL